MPEFGWNLVYRDGGLYYEFIEEWLGPFSSNAEAEAALAALKEEEKNWWEERLEGVGGVVADMSGDEITGSNPGVVQGQVDSGVTEDGLQGLDASAISKVLYSGAVTELVGVDVETNPLAPAPQHAGETLLAEFPSAKTLEEVSTFLVHDPYGRLPDVHVAIDRLFSPATDWDNAEATALPLPNDDDALSEVDVIGLEGK